LENFQNQSPLHIKINTFLNAHANKDGPEDLKNQSRSVVCSKCWTCISCSLLFLSLGFSGNIATSITIITNTDTIIIICSTEV
jgi:hypothetical protein